MGVGQMNKKAEIIEITRSKDSAGFNVEVTNTLASIRCYVEGRHGSERWANLSTFSEATELFRFRKIHNLTVTTKMYIVFDNVRYDILSVEGIHGRGMYIEVLAKRSEPSCG